ncbi:MAG: hypothetical protein JEZ07_06490 [Phycisphaerae bacterium]|nr:hypothetical protein [Phycisphaerae bacterium]
MSEKKNEIVLTLKLDNAADRRMLENYRRMTDDKKLAAQIKQALTAYPIEKESK